MSYGKARTGVLSDPAAGFVAYDGFDQAAGPLTGLAAPQGGSWSFAGDADDFNVGAIGPLGANNLPATVAQRTATLDTAGFNGRFEILGTTNYAAVSVQVDLRFSVGPYDGRIGVIARYTNTSNLIRAVLQPLAQSVLTVDKRVAGTVTTIAQYPGQNAPGSLVLGSTFYTLKLVIDTAGQYQVWLGGTLLITGRDVDLATGGALATGKPGIYDANLSSTAVTRDYDNFQVSAPTSRAVLFASRTTRFLHDQTLRQNSAGSSEGKVPIFEGEHLQIPPATRANRVSRVVFKLRRYDVDAGFPDLGLGDTATASLTVTPLVDFLSTVTSTGFPAYSLMSVSTDRVINANSTSLNELANVLGSVINDHALGAVPAYTLTNVTTDRTINANLTTEDELADVLCTMIADLIAPGVAPAYTITNLVTSRTLNAVSTTIDTYADVLGTFINDLVTAGAL